MHIPLHLGQLKFQGQTVRRIYHSLGLAFIGEWLGPMEEVLSVKDHTG